MRCLFIGIVLSISMVMLACVSRPFQPAPSDFERWRKRGADNAEVKKVMAKCGFSNPFNNGNMDAEAYAGAQNCMLREGYSHDYERGVLCNQKEYQELHACKLEMRWLIDGQRK